MTPNSSTKASLRTELLSGFTVALALVPEAVAFAFVAGVSPIVGLYGAFMMGLITSVFGGRPGMISGATGAMAVVMVSLVAHGNDLGAGLGVQYLFVTLLLCGILQMLAGILRLGKFVRMIPSPVMMGFVNGLAIVIFLSQLGMFKEGGVWLEGTPLITMLGLTGLTMAIIVGLPKLTKQIPPALTAILVVSAIVIFGDITTQTVKSFIVAGGGDGLAAGLPTFAIPQIPWSVETLVFILPYAAILAAIGLIESLMTLNLIDELTETRGNTNRECIAQGAANMTNCFFGGMGGCAMIGQSIINIKSGGRGRLSGIAAALLLLGFILFGSKAIEAVPIAALVGVMFMVVIGTFAWNTFKIVGKVPYSDILVMLTVTGLTVAFDLAIAVICGVILSALIFAWQHATHISVRSFLDDEGAKHYEVVGPLFFASTTPFNHFFQVQSDPEEIYIDFEESRIADQSAIEAVNKLTELYRLAGKKVHLRHLSPDCRRLIQRADKIVEVNVLEDPDYYVAVDKYGKALGDVLGQSVDLTEAQMEAMRGLGKFPRKKRATLTKRQRRASVINRKNWRSAFRKNKL